MLMIHLERGVLPKLVFAGAILGRAASCLGIFGICVIL